MKKNDKTITASDLVAQVQGIANQQRNRKSAKAKPQLDLPFEQLLPPQRGRTARYPTLLTRIPIFSPVQDRRTLDSVRGDIIATSWGSITRFGQGLDIFDEDTLFALVRLCAQRRLSGPREVMPVPVLRVVRNDDGENEPRAEHDAASGAEPTVVIAGNVTAQQINNLLWRPVGGSNLNATRESIKRLALTQLFFENETLKKEGTTKFFDYIGDSGFRGEIYVQFTPIMTQLLETYTFINIDIRRALTDTGKAIHRFLSSQSQQRYSIGLSKLQEAVRYPGRSDHFKRAAVQTLDQLVDLQWLKSWELTGNGRSQPFTLTVVRAK